MMKKKSMLLLGIAVVLVLALVLWVFSANVMVGGRMYSKNSRTLDLRGQAIRVEEYEALRQKLPGCEVQWDVPLSSGTFPEETEVLTLSALTEEDINAIGYFPKLHTVEAEGCTDYLQLQQLQQKYPQLDVHYSVVIGGERYLLNTTGIALSSLSEEDIVNLRYLPELEFVHVGACRDTDQLESLKQAYPDLVIATELTIAGKKVDMDATKLEAKGVSWEEAEMLRYLPKLKAVHLSEPDMEAGQLLQLRSDLPDAKVSWDVTVNGQKLSSDTVEAEFTRLDMGLEELAEGLAYLPELEKVFFNECGVDNETMAAFREEKRDAYKVVWTIHCGELMLRTDDLYYMPRKYELKTGDEAIVDLKYCEDMVCIDIGHSLSVTHCEWAAYMPNLKYLILAETGVKDLTPLSGLKNLIFLEIFLSQVNDYSPLLGCSALEDLNLCYTKGDLEVLGQMTWLKRLWIGRAHMDVWNHKEELAEKLPDCEINTDVIFSTGQGWRQNKNYFDMRDVLGMFYMK